MTMEAIKVILYLVCLASFISALFIDNKHASKWFNYVGCTIMAIYVFLIQ